MEIRAHDLTNSSRVVIVQLLQDNEDNEGYAIVTNDQGEIYSQGLSSLRVHGGLRQFGVEDA